LNRLFFLFGLSVNKIVIFGKFTRFRLRINCKTFSANCPRFFSPSISSVIVRLISLSFSAPMPIFSGWIFAFQARLSASLCHRRQKFSRRLVIVRRARTFAPDRA
jgi:hypothetical protein